MGESRVARMPGYFRALALDYDGTIARGGRPTDGLLAALDGVRAGGRRLVLVTGRILRELRADFPEVERHFDAIVAENGATLARAGRERPLARRVSEQLELDLRAAGIPLQRGSVILAMDAQHDRVVREHCVRLGIDAQLVRNRGALMVLPSGVNKGSGVREALAELGISTHNAVGIGDAENDLALLEACEIGVAVHDAVPSLRAQADEVLPATEGAMAAWITGPLRSGLPLVQPARRRIELGITADGEPVMVAASRRNLFIDGATGVGKSYLAGAFAERVIEAGYTVCVLDPEGEHSALAQLPGVLALGGGDPLPSVEEVGHIVQLRFSSVVIDMSLREETLKRTYTCELLEKLSAVRRTTGLPHWVLLEEAHGVPSAALEKALHEGALCLVTYRPDWLGKDARSAADVAITVQGVGRAVLKETGKPALPFTFGGRQVVHTRHRRKYAEGRVPYDLGFTFRDARGWVGEHVVSLQEFAAELEHAPRASVAHHAARHDFSRWIEDVFRDTRLAGAVARAERSFDWNVPTGFLQSVRELVALRYTEADEA